MQTEGWRGDETRVRYTHNTRVESRKCALQGTHAFGWSSDTASPKPFTGTSASPAAAGPAAAAPGPADPGIGRSPPSMLAQECERSELKVCGIAWCGLYLGSHSPRSRATPRSHSLDFQQTLPAFPLPLRRPLKPVGPMNKAESYSLAVRALDFFRRWPQVSVYLPLGHLSSVRVVRGFVTWNFVWCADSKVALHLA